MPVIVEIENQKLVFPTEEALISFQSGEMEDQRSPEAIRQQRHRDRENRADTYWKFRIRNNRVLPGLIADSSLELVEQARDRALVEHHAFVELHPERVTE